MSIQDIPHFHIWGIVRRLFTIAPQPFHLRHFISEDLGHLHCNSTVRPPNNGLVPWASITMNLNLLTTISFSMQFSLGIIRNFTLTLGTFDSFTISISTFIWDRLRFARDLWLVSWATILNLTCLLPQARRQSWYLILLVLCDCSLAYGSEQV